MTEGKPIASVIIVGYMDKKFIDGCLSAVLDQDLQRSEYEVIFGDNASPDGSGDYVEQNYPGVKLIRFPKNYGFSEGNNRAVKYAKGRYLVFLNLDTVAHRQWLSEMIRTMQENPDLGACYSNQIGPVCPEYKAMDRNAKVENIYLPVISPFGYVDAFVVPYQREPIRSLFLSGGSFMIDRKVLDELGYLFDEEYFIYAEDLDLGLRIYSIGYEVALSPTSILYHDTGTSIYNPEEKPAYQFKTVNKLIKILRNRFITYYKNMYPLEFLLYFPIMLIGAPLKATSVHWNTLHRVAIFLGTIPTSIIASLLTFSQISRFRAKHKDILANRQTNQFWLIKALLSRYPPVPSGSKKLSRSVLKT